ncbi:MAG TPA: hypothetical protein VFK94_06440 [Patescibacteria group bacterium]|nr:hypothetical protein [Patescibacteria group bacterium]
MSRNILDIPNPDGQDSVTYTNILLERAPDVGGAPGTFAQIASITIDVTNEMTHYVDTAGTATDWYRHRYNTGATNSDYSGAIQYGDYTVRQWIKADIVDADITSSDWDRWRDQTMNDIALMDLGRMAPYSTIAPTSYTTEWYDLAAEQRTVVRVDIYDTSGYYITSTPEWEQQGRQIRIVNPNTSLRYRVYATAEIRSFKDLDDELFMLLYWGMRLRYIDKRIADRTHFRKFLGSTKGEEVSTAQLLQLKRDAQAEWVARIQAASRRISVPAMVS